MRTRASHSHRHIAHATCPLRRYLGLIQSSISDNLAAGPPPTRGPISFFLQSIMADSLQTSEAQLPTPLADNLSSRLPQSRAALFSRVSFRILRRRCARLVSSLSDLCRLSPGLPEMPSPGPATSASMRLSVSRLACLT